APFHVLTQLRPVEQQPATDPVRTDPAALEQVVNGLARAAAAQVNGGAVDLEEAVVAAVTEQIGDSAGKQLELLGGELDGEGDRSRGFAHVAVGVLGCGWQLPQTRRPPSAVQSLPRWDG